MSKTMKYVAALVTAAICGGLGSAPASAAAPTIPASLTEQGRLLDDTDAPVDGVSLLFTFALYTTSTGGANIWTEKQTITPDKGYFSAKLGEVTPFPATVFDGSQPGLYLGITIGTDTEMAPRQQITSVPFALLALNAATATHALAADNAALATNATNASTATGALDTRIKALETTVAALNAAPKAFGTSFYFGGGSCASAATACAIDISGGHFTTIPNCTVSNTAIDNTGYSENMVIANTTAATLYVWKGLYVTGGSTMAGTVTCVGK